MNPLAAHYSRFRVGERLLLTGHSHQAWPDAGFSGQQQAWLDAAELVDQKWARASEVAERVRAGWRRLLGDAEGDITLGTNTHELVVRLLSAVITSTRTRVVSTDGEFHTIRRQLDRLAEAGVDVVKVAARPADTLAERLTAAVNDATAVVLVSSVLFETAEIVPGLPLVAAAARQHGAALLVDAYHHLNVVPFGMTGLEDAFITGGGYKYAQLGEGNCFLRVPPGCALRPVITGWFAEFGELAEAKRPGEVRYASGAARFAGATYDPASHYRAAAVFDFFEQQQLTPDRLRAISLHQVALLERDFRSLDAPAHIAALPELHAHARAGFLSIRVPNAQRVVETLRARGMHTDARGEWLRLGPAPYLGDQQLRDAIALLGQTLKH